VKLYNIIKSLQQAQGNINKQAILMEHKDNVLFKKYMKAVYDPSINYYQKAIPKYPATGMNLEFSEQDIEEIIRYLADRAITGNSAKDWLAKVAASLNFEGEELLTYIIDRSIGASVGNTMVLKTWPDLYFSVPYMRCSLLDKKAKERFSKLDNIVVQTKADSVFGYLVKRHDGSYDVITRAGSRYPQWFAKQMTYGMSRDTVIVGELEVYNENGLLDRKTGSGILNSILKDGSAGDNEVDVRCSAWDILTYNQFVDGKSPHAYIDRLQMLKEEVELIETKHISVIPTWFVGSLEEAYTIYGEHTAKGLEGCIIKDPKGVFKDGTSKDCVKLKVEFEIELEVTGMLEGSGKAKGMLGALQLKSSDGVLVVDVGTGFTDQMRKDFWVNQPKVVTVKANDIISKRGCETKSLFLPVFVEERFDKNVADDYIKCLNQLNSAKGL